MVGNPITLMTIPDNAQWWWSQDDERFNGPFDTRAAAIAEAESWEQEAGFYICQATKPAPAKLFGHFDAADFIERANDESAEFMGEDGDPLFDPNAEQQADLQAMVWAAIDAWQEKHKLVFMEWCFAWQGPSEWISTKPVEEGGAA